MLAAIGFSCIAVGGLWLLGVRWACLLFVPDLWVCKKLLGIELGPYYRKTEGVLAVCLGLFLLWFHWHVSSGRFFLG